MDAQTEPWKHEVVNQATQKIHCGLLVHCSLLLNKVQYLIRIVFTGVLENTSKLALQQLIEEN